MDPIEELETQARQLLDGRPGAAVRVRLLRDVLLRPAADPDLVAAMAGLAQHPRVRELTDEQLPDGSWGRFHSMDSRRKKRFPTSESALRLALALGLDKDSPVLSKAARYMEAVLAGERTWVDRVEKSDWWELGVECITAAALAQVDPGHPAIRKPWEYWAEAARRTLAGGRYDEGAEVHAHRALSGRHLTYLRSRYALTLLGARSRDLPPVLDRRIVAWIWNEPRGLGYLEADLRHPTTSRIHNWLESLEVLADFQSWRDVCRPALDWLRTQRLADGRWDFGPGRSRDLDYPLSDDRRKKGNRSIDQTARVLALLRRSLA